MYIHICIYAYMHICIGGWGKFNREIVSFRSCVRASGRGEAKLRVGVNRQEARDPRRAKGSGTAAPAPRLRCRGSGATPGRGVP